MTDQEYAIIAGDITRLVISLVQRKKGVSVAEVIAAVRLLHPGVTFIPHEDGESISFSDIPLQ